MADIHSKLFLCAKCDSEGGAGKGRPIRYFTASEMTDDEAPDNRDEREKGGMRDAGDALWPHGFLPADRFVGDRRR